MEEKEVIAKNLEFYRKKQNLSQLELAKKLNYSNKNISKWENAETTPSVFVLNEIAKLYGIKVDDLLNEKTVKPQDENNDKVLIENRKKKLFRIAMLMLANALIFVAGTIAIYVLGLLDITSFNKWMIYLYLTPLSVLTILIYVRVLYKYVSFILTSLFGWLICVCVYLSLTNVININLIFVLGASYQVMAIFIAMLANIKLSNKVQTIFDKVFKHKNKKTNKEQNTTQPQQELNNKI